jgi:hypothetical protein
MRSLVGWVAGRETRHGLAAAAWVKMGFAALNPTSASP